jgi:zinc protease
MSRLSNRLCAAALAATLAPAAQALPSNVEHVETFRGVAQYRLKSNGMPILLVPDHASPVVTFMVVYHVGSRNEAPGNTGSAHLLEHMIFNKSTENFGKANGHKTFQEVLHEVGSDANSSNMTTGYDRMNGYSTVPADKLELAMKIEADRLGRGLILESERQTEMSVVRNEFEISENDPQRALLKATVGTAFQAHPYRWPVIGYRSDIEGVTIEKLREHYKTYFWPDNAEAVLVGDFDPEQALAMFDREFGGFGKSPRPIPGLITVEPPQEGERRVIVRRPGTQGHVLIGYMRPGALHADFPVFELIEKVLSDGANSRLRLGLVEKSIATNVRAFNWGLADPFPFFVGGTVGSGRTHDEVEAAMKSTLAAIAKDGVTDAELARAKQQFEVEFVRELDGPYRHARLLGEGIATGSWKRVLALPDAVRAVTVADVRRVASTYFVPDHATVGWFIADNAAPRQQPIGAKAGEGSAAAPIAASDTPAPRSTDRPGAPFAERTKRTVLANGVTLDVVENHAAPTVAIRGVIVGGDAASPPERPVMNALLAKVLERGTTSRTREEIGALLDDVGATRAYATTPYDTTITAGGMARDLDLILDVIADELQRPAIKPDELAKAKKELEADILRLDDDTGRRAMERLGQLVFPPAHPYRPYTRAEKLAALGGLTDTDLQAFRRAHYGGAGLILTIVGDVDAAAAVASVAKQFGEMPRGRRDAPPPGPRLVANGNATREAVTMRGKANMNIVMGAPSGLMRRDPDYEAALIANAVLGQSALASRIGRRVRDAEGLSYSLASRYSFMEDRDGLWYLIINVAPQNLAKALKSSREEIDRYAKEGATKGEVEEQKSFFAGNYRVNLGSNGGIADALVFAERHGFGPKYLDEFPGRIAAVTLADVNAALARHFFADHLHVVVAGDLDRLPGD